MSKEEEPDKIEQLNNMMIIIDHLYHSESNTEVDKSARLTLIEATINEILFFLERTKVTVPTILYDMRRDILGLKSGENTKLFKPPRRISPRGSRVGGFNALILKVSIQRLMNIVREDNGINKKRLNVKETINHVLEILSPYKEELMMVFPTKGITHSTLNEWRKKRVQTKAEREVQHIIHRNLIKNRHKQMLAGALLKRTSSEVYFEEVVKKWIPRVKS